MQVKPANCFIYIIFNVHEIEIEIENVSSGLQRVIRMKPVNRARGTKVSSSLSKTLLTLLVRTLSLL